MYLGIDTGGTKTLLGVFSDDGQLTHTDKFPTKQDYSQYLQDLSTHIQALPAQNFTAIGLAIPGIIDRQHGIGVSFGNLPWHNATVKQTLEQAMGVPVALENDAKVGALSEAMNVKNEFKHVLFVTIGTGIGLAIVNDGVIDTEFGDRGGDGILIEHEGTMQKWEDVVSGQAIADRFHTNASELTDETAWRTIVHDLALGLAPLINEKQPDVVIFGGGAGKPFDRYGKLLEEELRKKLSTCPPLRPAKYPDEAVIYGCYYLAKALADATAH